MPTRQRQNNNSATFENVEYTKPELTHIVYKIGIYGWRKRCLYFLILLILIIAIINLALTIWIIRVQDFGLHGMGKLHITSNGLRMDGTAEFLSVLRAKTIMSRTNSPIRVNSRKNISLSAVDAFNNVVGQITLDSDHVILKNKKLYIQDGAGRTLLFADDKKIKMNIERMDISVPGGLNLESSIQTPLVQASDSKDLRLESLTNKLKINAAKGVEIKSNAHDVKLESLMDTKLTSKKGKILLDAKKIILKNLRKSQVPGKSENGDVVHGGTAEVCMCTDGTLFLAPPDVKRPCKITSGVCLP